VIGRDINKRWDFFERVKGANLSLKPSKCKIGFHKVNFLGHTLQKNSVGPQVETVGRILNTKRVKSKKECRSLLGMIHFYRRYIPNCTEIITPITELTNNSAPNNVEWGDRQEKAFSEMKRLLSNEPILKLPDLNEEFILKTDASNQSLGGCLLQMHEGVKHRVICQQKANPERAELFRRWKGTTGNNLGSEEISQISIWSTLHTWKWSQTIRISTDKPHIKSTPHEVGVWLCSPIDSQCVISVALRTSLQIISAALVNSWTGDARIIIWCK